MKYAAKYVLILITLLVANAGLEAQAADLKSLFKMSKDLEPPAAPKPTIHKTQAELVAEFSNLAKTRVLNSIRLKGKDLAENAVFQIDTCDFSPDKLNENNEVPNFGVCVLYARDKNIVCRAELRNTDLRLKGEFVQYDSSDCSAVAPSATRN